VIVFNLSLFIISHLFFLYTFIKKHTFLTNLSCNPDFLENYKKFDCYVKKITIKFNKIIGMRGSKLIT